MGAKDCLKEEVRWRQGLQLAQTKHEKNENTKKRKKRKPKSKEDSVLSSSLSSPTKVERKALLQERKRILKAAWSSSSDESKMEEDAVSVPPNFKKFTIEDLKNYLVETCLSEARSSRSFV